MGYESTTCDLLAPAALAPPSNYDRAAAGGLQPLPCATCHGSFAQLAPFPSCRVQCNAGAHPDSLAATARGACAVQGMLIMPLAQVAAS